MLNRLLAIVATVAAALAVAFGLRAKQKEAEADRDRLRADISDAVNTTTQHINENLHETELRHREEQQDSDARLAAGHRNHLEKNW